MGDKILRYHAQHQAQRAQKLTGKLFADRFQQVERHRNMNFGPKVSALFDVLGETMESIIYDDEEVDMEAIEMFEDLDINQQDKFHNANPSPPPSLQI